MKARIGIVGGSIAGCAAALGASRAGCDVTIFERATGLHDRGFGVGMPAAAYDELTAAGYLPSDLPICPVTERLWIIAEPGEPTGRVLWRQAMPALATSWGRLWSALANRVEPCYRAGERVTSVEADGTVVTENGGTHTFDLVIGADGHQSLVRSAINPGARPQDGGYALWRGTITEQELPQSLRSIVESCFVTVVFAGGHAVFYLIPASAGGRLLMWAIYGHSRSPHEVDLDEMGEKIAESLPSGWADACHKSDVLGVHPVTDMTATSYIGDRLLLLGDAATLARPHTASGAVKAMLDGKCLESSLLAGAGLSEVLALYDDQRRPEGNRLVEIGRRLGAAMVERTPPWGSMTPDDLSGWTAAVLGGHSHYLYRSS